MSVSERDAEGSSRRLKRKQWDRKHYLLDVNSDNLKGDPTAPPFQADSRPGIPGAPPAAPRNVEVCPSSVSRKCRSHLHSILKAASPFHKKPRVGFRLSPSSAQPVEQTQGLGPEFGVHFALCRSLDPPGGGRGHHISVPLCHL